MSYNFAVWEGAAPLSNAHATSEFERRCDLLATQLEDSIGKAVSPGIRDFVDALIGVHPDAPQPSRGGGPWADGPLINNATGDFIYFAAVPDRVEDVGQLVMQSAADLGLVAFDPQVEELMPSATSGVRSTEFDLPVAHELALHLEALIEEALAAGPTFVGIVQEEATGSFIQWMAGTDGSLAIEVQGESLQSPRRRLNSDGESEMRSLGFADEGTNWSASYQNGRGSIETASNLLAHALCEIRRVPPGAAMSVQTFPA